MNKEDLNNALLDCMNYVNLQGADPLEAIEHIAHTLFHHGYTHYDVQERIENAWCHNEENNMALFEE